MSKSISRYYFLNASNIVFSNIIALDIEWGKFSLYFFTYLPSGEKAPTFDKEEDQLAYVFGLRHHCIEITQ
jgi:hypothetical protein